MIQWPLWRNCMMTMAKAMNIELYYDTKWWKWNVININEMKKLSVMKANNYENEK